MAKNTFTLWLERASVVYLALPLLLFLLGFLNIAAALATAAALCAGLWYFLKAPAKVQFASALLPPPAESPNNALIPRRIIFAAAAASLLVCMCFGFGGWGELGWDWEKHRAMLTHLTDQPWPPLVDWNGNEHLLVYYIAHYIPAAAFGKLFGFAAGNHFHLLWSALGVTLSVLWVFVFSRTAAMWIIAVFFFFSGLDLAGVFIANWLSPHLGPYFHVGETRYWNVGDAVCFNCQRSLDPWGWALLYEFGSHLTDISWISQHAIAGWLSAALVLFSIARGRLPRRALLFAPLTLLHSVFVTLWLGVFIALYAFWNLLRAAPWREKLLHLRAYFSPEMLCALPLLAVLFAYFHSEQNAAFIKFAEPGWNVLFGRLLILALEFALLWLLLLAADWHLRRKHGSAEGWLNGDLRLVFFLALLSVLALSGFAMEPYGKDVQRNACIAPIFILMLCTVRLLEEARLPQRRALKNFATAAVIMLCLGAWTPLVRLNSAFAAIYQRGGIVQWHQPVQRHSVLGHNVISHQYLRPTDSLFYRHLADRPAPSGN